MTRERPFLRNISQHEFLCSVFFCGVALRFFRLDEPQLWLDEIIQLLRFEGPSLLKNILDLKHEIAAVPLDYIVQHAVVRLMGTGEFWVRFHAAVFGCLTLPVLYLLAKRVLSRRAAVLAVLLLAFFPLHWAYSQEGRNYSLFVFLTVLSYLSLVSALREDRAHQWVLCGLTNLPLLYTNYFGLLVLFSQMVGVVTLRLSSKAAEAPFGPCPEGGRLVRNLSCWLIPILLFLPWALWTAGSVQPKAANPLLEPGLLVRLFKELSGGGYPLSLLLTVLATGGWLGLRRDGRRMQLILLAAWLLLPIPVVVILDWWGGYFFAARQLLFATPAWILLAAAGLDSVPTLVRDSWGRRLQLAAAGLAVVLGVGAVALSDKKEEADWKGLAAYLRAETLPEDVVCVPGLERIVGFRFPEIHNRTVPIRSLSEILRQRPMGRAHLIESRYQSPADRDVLRAARESLSSLSRHELSGFRIDVVTATGR